MGIIYRYSGLCFCILIPMNVLLTVLNVSVWVYCYRSRGCPTVEYIASPVNIIVPCSKHVVSRLSLRTHPVNTPLTLGPLCCDSVYAVSMKFHTVQTPYSPCSRSVQAPLKAVSHGSGSTSTENHRATTELKQCANRINRVNTE